MTLAPLYTADQASPAFDANKSAVDIVCCGDSLTGWNNYGPADSWPYSTYPQLLQGMCQLMVANGGIAGEISDNGPQQVRDYLELFPNARHFIIGMGTNDLGMGSESERIIENLGQMVQLVRGRGRHAVIFNVPNANEAMFPSHIANELRAKRDYHNARLKEFCGEQGIPLADICSKLHDEHFADELHPNEQGAKIIAEEVFKLLAPMHKAWQKLPE